MSNSKTKFDPIPADEVIRTGEYPVLIALQGPLEGHRWEIRDELLIGRENDCNITIEDRQVSRHHVRITNTGLFVEMEDLISKNGTFHKGSQLKEKTSLDDGDIIQIALVQKFAFYTSDATIPVGDLHLSLAAREKRINVDQKSRRVWIQGEEITPPLSAPQFKLLAELYSQPGQVISRNDLIQAIWSDEQTEGVSDQALDALIRRLRDRLAEIDPGHNYIQTVRGNCLRLVD
jgi:pSer/pThr/pTyr-binding forkhead associated (FHA) protein